MKASTILGLDFGERRIGIALSDTGKTLATGLMTLDCRQNPNFMESIGDIIREEAVIAIVVGYPLRTDGKKGQGDKTEAVDAFISKLETQFKLPVHREDESFTSQMAAQSLKSRSRKKRGRRPDKGEIDRVAACYILQDFLDNPENGYRTA